MKKIKILKIKKLHNVCSGVFPFSPFIFGKHLNSFLIKRLMKSIVTLGFIPFKILNKNKK